MEELDLARDNRLRCSCCGKSIVKMLRKGDWKLTVFAMIEVERDRPVRVKGIPDARIGFSSRRGCITSVKERRDVKPEYVLGIACSTCTDGQDIDFTVYPHAEMGVEEIKKLAVKRLKADLARETVAA